MDKENAAQNGSQTLKSNSTENAAHQLPDEERGLSPKANFEDAITACGYGKFQYFVFLAFIPACFAQVYSAVTMTYVIPIAECDLKLTNNDKGALTAATYIGLTVGAFFGGFASDVFGRRRVIIYGHLAEFVFNVAAAFSFSFWFLFLMKICAGFSSSKLHISMKDNIFWTDSTMGPRMSKKTVSITLPAEGKVMNFIGGGPIASLFSYAAETHSNEKRHRIIMMNGAISALSQSVQPVLAHFIIPLEFRFQIIHRVLDFSSWRLFFLICTLPSILAVVTTSFLPESPKFLMTRGRTNEALEVFKQIYVLNTGKSAKTYPIHDLETPAKRTIPTSSATNPSKAGVAFDVIRNGWRQVQPIFSPPYLNIAVVVFVISGCTLTAMNTIRFWAPQLFATLDEATRLRENTTGISTICDLIASVVQGAPSDFELAQEGHTRSPISGHVYLRSFIISALAAVSYIFTTPIIGLIGKKKFAKVCFPAAGVMAISINWTTNKDIFMALLAVYTALVRNCFSVMSTITVDLFPTAFRSLAMSMIMTCGLLASGMGNFLFPVILSLSCGAIFFSLGGILKLASVLVWFVSNKTDNR